MNCVTSTTVSDNFIIPSEEIQRLFAFENDSNIIDNVRGSNLPVVVDEYSFTEEEFSKMPSTLIKVVKRTEALLLQTEIARKSAIETNNELKSIHSLIVRYAKKTLKDSVKNDTTVEPIVKKDSNIGFNRQCQISDDMCAFIGIPNGSMSSRVEVNRTIYNYVKKYELFDKNNAQCILPDEKLWSILSEEAKGNKITYFSIQKYIQHHYKKNK